MKLPSYIRINTSDYKQEYQDMIAKLSVSVNNIIDSIMQALNNNISLKDNIYCVVSDVVVTTDSSGNPINTTSYPITLQTKPIGVSVISVINQTNSTGYPTSGVTISFTPQTTAVVINNVTGLIPGDKYSLRVITWG